jgi:large subunit ribosomal protein L10Ae
VEVLFVASEALVAHLVVPVATRRKLSNETVVQAVQEIRKAAGAKKRKFVETIELQVALKNYDPNKDKRFGGALKLPTIPRPKYKVTPSAQDLHSGENSVLTNLCDVVRRSASSVTTSTATRPRRPRCPS